MLHIQGEEKQVYRTTYLCHLLREPFNGSGAGPLLLYSPPEGQGPDVFIPVILRRSLHGVISKLDTPVSVED